MWLFISEFFRFEILGFEQVQGAFYKVFVGRLASLTRKRFASGRFSSCDECSKSISDKPVIHPEHVPEAIRIPPDLLPQK
jgi:hypothetical protein